MKNLLNATLFVLLCLFGACKKEGCMDSAANNVNDEANVDNGYCTYEIAKLAGEFQVEGYKIPYQTTDTTHYTYTLKITYKNGKKALLTNLGGTNQSIEAELYSNNSQITLISSKKDSLGTWSGYGTYYNSNSFGIAYTEGLQPTKHVEKATR